MADHDVDEQEKNEVAQSNSKFRAHSSTSHDSDDIHAGTI